MSHSNTARPYPSAPPNPLFLRDEELIEGLELLQFACDDLFAEQNRLLAELELGRSHQRLLHFIGRRPGITMATLLELVPLSKQSQSRLLRELVAKGLIAQAKGRVDRREKPLSLTEKGLKVDQKLGHALRQRLAIAYRSAGADAVAGHHTVLKGLINDQARRTTSRRAGTP